MIRHKMFKMRIYPSHQQLKYINMVFAAQRKVRNTLLTEYIDSFMYQLNNGSRSYNLPDISISDIIRKYQWLKYVPQYMLYSAKYIIDNEMMKFINNKNVGLYPTFPKYHSCNAHVTLSYCDKTKFVYQIGKNENHHWIINLPHLGAVEVLKIPNQNIQRMFDRYQLIFGINVECINVKITKTSDDKYYAMLVFEFEDGILEYASQSHRWNHNVIDQSHAIAIHDMQINDTILCQDSKGNQIDISTRVIRLSKSIDRLNHKTISCKRDHINQVRLRDRKRKQLHDVMISIMHSITNQYVYDPAYDVIIFPQLKTYKCEMLDKIHQLFRHYMTWKIQKDAISKHILYITLSRGVMRRKSSYILNTLIHQSCCV